MKIEGFESSMQKQMLHQIHLQAPIDSRRKIMSAEQEFKWFIAAVLGWLSVIVVVAIMM
jgi:hypothetical protein